MTASPAVPDTREWAIYVRVSKLMGREGDNFVSPEQQQTACRAFLTLRSQPPVADEQVYIDLDKTGRDDNRPQFQAMMAWVRDSPRRRGICVMDGSRLFRNTSEFLSTVNGLSEIGAEYVSVHEAVDASTPEGALMTVITAGIHQFQSDTIARRWRMVLNGRLEQGLPKNGKARFGYQIATTVDDAGNERRARIQTPHPVKGPRLRKMYEDFISGMGAQRIAKTLNDDGHLTERGNTWSVQTVLRTLDSGFGAGMILVHDYERRQKRDNLDKPMTHNGRPVMERVRVESKYVDGIHEPVISRDQWDLYRRTRDSRRVKPAKHKAPRWHLAGLAKCGLCGSNLIVVSYKDPKTLVICSRYKSSRTCTGVWIKKSSVEKVVFFWLGGRLDEVASHTGGDAAQQAEEDRATLAIAAHTDTVERLTREKVGLARQNASGLLRDDEFAIAVAENTAEIETARASLDSARVDLERSAPQDDVYEQLIDFGQRIGAPGEDALGDGEDPYSDEYLGAVGASSAQYNALLAKVIDSVTVTGHEVQVDPVVGRVRAVPRI